MVSKRRFITNQQFTTGEGGVYLKIFYNIFIIKRLRFYKKKRQKEVLTPYNHNFKLMSS